MIQKRKGLFLTFEGGEGSGKTTQARLLHEHLAGMGWEVLLVREPGGTAVGEKIRKILLHTGSEGMKPLSELFLYLAARREHVAVVIKPAVESGATVIADRFSDATTAYQGYGRGLDPALIRQLDSLVCEGLEPDITFLVDPGSVEKGLERALARHSRMDTGKEEGRFEQEALSFHRRVQRGYREIASRHPERMVIIDGSQTVEEVHLDVLRALKERFPDKDWGSCSLKK